MTAAARHPTPLTLVSGGRAAEREAAIAQALQPDRATAVILGGLADVVPKLRPGRAPYISFLTGPSRTADIERVLTIGVHGPSRLVVVVHDGDGAEVTP